MDNYSYISNADVGYLDQLYQKYKQDPASVDVTWQKFFEGYEFSLARFGENGASEAGPSIKETQVRNMIFAYRSFGHLKSDTKYLKSFQFYHFHRKTDECSRIDSGRLLV